MAALLLLAGLLGVGIWRELMPAPTTIPGTRLVLEQPPSWISTDAGQVFDESWAADQKRKYPEDAPLIDSLMKGIQSGGITWFARIDLDGDQTSEAWVLASAKERGVTPETLQDEAAQSVLRQSVKLRPGTSAVERTLSIGRAIQLDWSYDLRHADGTMEIGTVRSYWLLDGTKTVVVQLTYYGEQPDVIRSFDAVAATFRWAP
jgi:hypothetical protein